MGFKYCVHSSYKVLPMSVKIRLHLLVYWFLIWNVPIYYEYWFSSVYQSKTDITWATMYAGCLQKGESQFGGCDCCDFVSFLRNRIGKCNGLTKDAENSMKTHKHTMWHDIKMWLTCNERTKWHLNAKMQF